jgi:hypothetical protein
MTPEQFCYWLRGFFELEDADNLSESRPRLKLEESRTDMIRKHLQSVFDNKIMSPQITQPVPGGTGAPYIQPTYTVTCRAEPPNIIPIVSEFIC